jgi:hypothetical protein
MKSALLVLSVLLVAISCSSGGSSVGSGAGFDTFTTQPTAADFGAALLNAAHAQSALARLRIPNSITALHSGTPGSETGTRNCFGGGTITYSESTDGTNGTGQATLSSCSVMAIVGGKTIFEKLSGSAAATVTQLTTGVKASYRASISASGDIGFAVDCDLTLSMEGNGNITGSCTFRDAAGHKIEGTGLELAGILP